MLYITLPEFTHYIIESLYPLTNIYMDYLIPSLGQLYVIDVIIIMLQMSKLRTNRD